MRFLTAMDYRVHGNFTKEEFQENFPKETPQQKIL